MIHIEFDMWPGEKKILLDDVLARLYFSCDVSWTLYEFSGSGATPDGGSMENFEKNILETSTGFQFGAGELEKFSKDITDITDITLVGFCSGKKIIEIIGFDSSDWEITADEASVDVSELCTSYTPQVQSSDWRVKDEAH